MMIYNKKRFDERGPKKRQSVIRAETNLRAEQRLEGVCKALCEIHNLDINDYIEIDAKNKWQTALTNIKNKVLTVDGVTYIGTLLKASTGE